MNEKDNSKQILTSEERLDICNECPNLKMVICTECGCFMPVKVLLESAKCPLQKW